MAPSGVHFLSNQQKRLLSRSTLLGFNTKRRRRNRHELKQESPTKKKQEINKKEIKFQARFFIENEISYNLQKTDLYLFS